MICLFGATLVEITATNGTITTAQNTSRTTPFSPRIGQDGIGTPLTIRPAHRLYTPCSPKMCATLLAARTSTTPTMPLTSPTAAATPHAPPITPLL